MKRLRILLTFIVIFTLTASVFSADASASWYDDVSGGTYSAIIGNPYVADTFCGVEARYSLVPGSYQCTELITRFYEEAYGLETFIFADYGYLVPGGAEPIEMLTSGYKFVTNEVPSPGDIVYSKSSMRENKGDHWAIVKSVSGSSITLFEQNVKYNSKAGTNRKVKYPSENYILYSPRSIYDNSKPTLKNVTLVATTAAPVTTVQQTEAPATTAKTTSAPTTAAASTTVQSSVASTTVAASTAAPTTAAPTTVAPSTTEKVTGMVPAEDGLYEEVVLAEDISLDNSEESTTAPEDYSAFAETFYSQPDNSELATSSARSSSGVNFKPILAAGAAILGLIIFLAILIFGKKAGVK